MKKLMLILVVLAAMWQVCVAEDLPDTVWSKNFGSEYISDCKFTPDGQKIVVSAGSNIYILETLTSKVLKLFSGSLGGGQVLISNDGKYLYASSKVKIDLYTYETLDTLKSLGRKNIAVRFTDLSPDGKYQIFTCVVVGKPFLDSNLVIIRTDDMEIEKILSINEEVGRIIFHPKENYFILQIGKDLTLWDTKTYTYIKTIYTDTNPINDIKFSPDGKMLGIVVGCDLKVFETNNFSIIKIIECKMSDGANRLVFSPNSKYIIYGTGSTIDENGRTKIIDTRDWMFTYVYPNPLCAFYSIDVSFDSRYIISAIGSIIYLLNSKGGINGIEEENLEEFFIKTRPNPASHGLIIDFSLPKPGKTIITLKDMLGKIIREIATDYYEPGIHSLNLYTNILPSGAYLITLEANNQHVSQKIIINK